MRKNKFKTIGILGGMGPEATLCLFNLIIDNTEAYTDQDHLPVIICNYPQIPDRTRHIVYGEESPLPGLQYGAKKLRDSGASMILIACNTAHYYLSLLQPAVDIPILNMIEITSAYVASCGYKKAGILATTGTLKTALYQKGFEDSGVEPVVLNDDLQESLVMEAIYGKEGIKAGFREKPLILLKEAVAILSKEGAQCIIGGCTEIPLVLNRNILTIPFINSMELLAREAIVVAGGVCREES